MRNNAGMTGRVEGKVIIVTGGAQGIGFGCAEMLAREGARVMIADVKQDVGAAAVTNLVAEGLSVKYVHMDVLKEASCAAAMEETIAQFGRLDGLLNNAGTYPRKRLEATTEDFWDFTINVNLRGPFFCCKHAAPLMKEGGGSIVNIGSVHGVQGHPSLVAYSAAKGGLLTMSKTLAGALAADRIRVNYVIPGWVLSEGEIALRIGQGQNLDDIRAAGKKTLLGRQQTPQDTAHFVVYLMSDESAQVTGTVMNIDGGMASLLMRDPDQLARDA